MSPPWTCARGVVRPLIVVSWVGCAGTIDDPSRFELGAAAALPVPTVVAVDAAARDAAWVPTDSGPSTASPPADAGVRAPWAADAGNASIVLVDAGASDAGSVQARDASTDASASCNFKALMMARCGNATCHGGPSSGAGLDLTTDGLAQRLAGPRGSDACSSYLLIDTDAPEKSALFLKVTDRACGVRMPLGGTLGSEEQLCILQWIERL